MNERIQRRPYRFGAPSGRPACPALKPSLYLTALEYSVISFMEDYVDLF